MSDYWSKAVSAADLDFKNEIKQRELLLKHIKCNLTYLYSVMDDSKEVINASENLCNTLEDILLHGLQGKSGKQYGNAISTSIWDFINYTIKYSGSSQLRSSLRVVERYDNVQTDDGQGRAWIRLIFNKNLLVTGFNTLIRAKNLQENWYASYAFMVSPSETEELMLLLAPLEDLSPCELQTDYDLLDSAREYTLLDNKIDDNNSSISKKKRKRKKKTIKPIIESKDIQLDSSPDDSIQENNDNNHEYETIEDILLADSSASIEISEDIIDNKHISSVLDTFITDSSYNNEDYSEDSMIIKDDTDIILIEDDYDSHSEIDDDNISSIYTNEENIDENNNILTNNIEINEDDHFIFEDTNDEASELEDNDIIDALKAIDDTSFLEQDQYASILKPDIIQHKINKNQATTLQQPSKSLLDNIQVVPGDRRDFFTLTVNADKTPLATQSFGKETYIIEPVHPIKESKTIQQTPDNSESIPLCGRFTRTEDGELALDLTLNSELQNIKGPPGWKQQQRIVYLTIHKKKTPADQFNLCAGCGCTLKYGLFSKVRYCEFSGKYFCSNCHGNQTFFIPGRILQQWDFSQYGISKFTYNFLEEIFEDPIFDLFAINPQIYQIAPRLKQIKAIRQQIFYMKDFIVTCNKHTINFMNLAGNRKYLLLDKHVYSLKDFIQVTQGKLQKYLQSIAEKLILHIKSCNLCLAKGFICEFCESKKPVYPFQLKTVVQCNNCKAFFHRNCYKKEKCPKCARIKTQKDIIVTLK